MQYIKDLQEFVGQNIQLKGWVQNKRSGKGIYFIILRDGTGFIQCVCAADSVSEQVFEDAGKLSLESSVSISGTVVKDERQEGGYELQVTDLEIIQIAEEYPIQKKEHGVEFLFDKRHLHLRSRRPWAIMKIRNRVIFAIHQFFQEGGFVQMDSPLFTGNAAEGTTTLFETEFYGQAAYLAQTGQLYGEAGAMALGKIYTFGPTFRAEKSKTRRHLSEFWMIEPEMAFYDNESNMDLIEEFVKDVVLRVLKDCSAELALLGRDVEELKSSVSSTFPRIPYREAVKILRGEQEVDGKTSIQMLEEDIKENAAQIESCQNEIKEREEKIASGTLKKGERNFNQNKVDKLKVVLKDLEAEKDHIPQWMESAKNFKDGEDLGGSDETVLTKLFGAPIMVYNWPAEIKAFYMKRAEDDESLVKGVDLLAPGGFGEIVGGSERESDLDLLKQRIEEHKLPMDAFEWYLDLRRFGSVPHAGFGLGLERFIQWIAGIHHIREVIPFPRYYGRLFP